MKQNIQKFIFLCKLSWKICPYLYFSKLLQVIIVVTQSFLFVILPKFIIDALTLGEDFNPVIFWIVVFSIAIVVHRGIDLLTRPWRNMCINRADIDTAKYYMCLATEMDYDKLEDSTIRDLHEVVQSEVRGGTAISMISEIATNVLQLIGFSTIVAIISPYMLPVMGIIVAVNAFVSRSRTKLDRRTIPEFRKNSRTFRYIDMAMTHFSFAKEVRINEVDTMFEEKYKQNAQDMWEIDTKYNRNLFLQNLISNVSNAIKILCMYGYAAYETFRGTITLGSFSMYVGAIGNVISAVSNLIDEWFQLKLSLEFVDQYFELEQQMYHTHKMQQEYRTIPDAPYTFAFHNVSFQYPNTNHKVLKNINLTIAPERKISIVGRNGAGKTTLIKLLCRLYLPTEGIITLNGIDINTFDRKEYARLLSVVFQDFRLFSFDVAENIGLDLLMQEERLYKAIEKAGLQEKISSLPNGIHTYVNKEFDENGVEFSGGQAQKLVLARAYYKNGSMVILDEPTASMDPVAELQLYERFHDMIGKNSAIFISHRLASTRFCDEIITLLDGEIQEQGTHKELMKKQGIYYDMFQTQAKLYQEEAMQ